MNPDLSKSERETLKAIYRHTKEQAEAHTGDLAETLGVTPGTVTATVKRLADRDLVDHRPYHGVQFTPAGRRLAVSAIRRHRIVERFLADMLGYAWNEADRLAPAFEHDLPDEVLDRLFVALNRPSTCPHGFPIPEPEQDEIPALPPLYDLEAGDVAEVAVPGSTDPEVVSFLDGLGRPSRGARRGAREAPLRRAPRAAGRRSGPHPGRAHRPSDLRSQDQRDPGWQRRHPRKGRNHRMTRLLAAEGGYQAFTLGSAEWTWLLISAGVAVLALILGVILMRGVLAQDTGTQEMQEIAGAIQEGASAYLKRQFRTIGMIVVPLAVIVFVTSTKINKELEGEIGGGGPQLRAVGRLTAPSPSWWAACSPGSIGFIGMWLAVRGNVRTAAAARQSDYPGALQGGLPHRRRRRPAHRRPRPAGRHHHHHDLPEHGHVDPRRLRLRRLAAGPVPAGRRRHLHQGGRRGRRPGGQGRGGHPRGRPPQPRHHRRQRGRQRGRLRRHGRRPVRELRRHPGGVDHPRRLGLPGHRPAAPTRRPRASSSRWPSWPSACWPR